MSVGAEAVEAFVEAVCRGGCRHVREVMAALEAGRPVAGAEGLDIAQRRAALAELRSIMAVYDARGGGVCGLS